MRLHLTTIEGGDSSGCQRVGGQIIQDFTEWKNLWDEHASILSRQPQIPSVDFSEEMAIAYFAGEKRQSGHRVEIDSVETQAFSDPRDHILVIKVREYASGRLSSDVMTQPYHIVRIPKVQFARVTFEIL